MKMLYVGARMIVAKLLAVSKRDFSVPAGRRHPLRPVCRYDRAAAGVHQKVDAIPL